MRYKVADYEWGVIRPMLPNNPRGIPRVGDRRLLNGIFCLAVRRAVARATGELSPRKASCNRFVRWREAGV
jgi:transposase